MVDKTGKTTMAIGETDDIDAIIINYKADAAITKGDPVYLSADDEVTPAGAAQDCIGIAMKTVADTLQCPILVRGRVKVKAGAAITRGKAVYGADAAQKVLMLTDVSQAVDEGGAAKFTVAVPFNRKLGYALETADNDGDLIFIYVEKS